MNLEEEFDPNAEMTPEQLAEEKKQEEEQQKKNPELWQKNNEWLDQFNNILSKITPEAAEAMAEKVAKLIEGEITWAELQGISPQKLFEISEFGYLQIQRGKLDVAEKIFKGLSSLDHRTAYYHAALGTIYQRQEKLADALAEYTAAVELDPADIASFVNRGEIYFKCDCLEQASADLDQAIQLDPQAKDPWANRGRFLKKMVLQAIEEDQKYYPSKE
ncbi:MAG: tetratricopeptide repeat protein [Deltaproteobacteria bacterium]|nr:tetratricopeptide repeat protein [Deltaproteobacteria bacterium]